MNVRDFKARIHNARDEEAIDALCLNWLKNKARDYGKEGRLADQLLEVVRQLLDQ